MSQSKPLSCFTPNFVSSNLKNFFLGSAHAREIRATRELYDRVQASYARHPLARQADRDRYISDIVFDVAEQFDPLPCRPLLLALGDLVENLLTLDGLADLPRVASIETLSIEESVALRSRLWRLLRFSEDWDRLSDLWRTKLVILCHGILGELPPSARGAYQQDDAGTDFSVSVPLIDLCSQAATLIERTMGTIYDDDVVGSHLFEAVRERFEHNLCAASGIRYDQRGQTSKTVITPSAYDAASNGELVRAYLGSTPFASFFATPLPFTIPFQARFEHTHILAGSGHGKTQTLQHFILSDLSRPDPPGLVIIDSQGDIALTLQAALERAALPEGKRRPAFLYIDEAADYFDDNIDDLLTQARKYNLGVVFSHQYLGQLAPALHSSIASNTSIKLAGGISDRDARSIAPDMRTTPTFILEQRKHERGTQFACYIRNHTGAALSLKLPFGALEAQPMMSDQAFMRLLQHNRARISIPAGLPAPPPPSPEPQAPPVRRAPRSEPTTQSDTEDWSS